MAKLRKVSRAGELLIILHNKSYLKQEEIFKTMLTNRIELEKNYIATSMFGLLLYPQNNTWDEEEIRKTGVLDLEALLQQGKLKVLPGGHVILNNQDHHKYIVKEITSMIEAEEI